MATIATMLVALGVDPSGVPAGLARAARDFERFADQARARLRNVDVFPDLTDSGRNHALQLIAGLQAEFEGRQAELQRQLETGLINAEQFRVLGEEAATNFRQSMTRDLKSLSAEGVIPPTVSRDIITLMQSTGDKAGEALRVSIERRMRRIGTGLQDIGRNLNRGVTLPIVAAATAAGAAALRIDDAMDRIRAGTGATGPVLQQLQRDFRATFTAVPASIDEVSEAITTLNQRLGISGAPLQALATQILDVARLTKSDLNATVDLSAQVFRNWRIATQDAGGALDFLFRTSQRTGVRMEQLLGTMASAGPIARQLGFSFEEAAALIGQFEREGLDVETTLRSMGIAIKKFSEQGVSAPEGLRALLEQIRTASTEMRAIDLASDIFPARSAAQMVAAIREGRFSIDALLHSVRASGDSIARAKADTDGWAEAWRRARNRIVLAADTVGVTLIRALERMLPAVERLIGHVANLADAFSRLPTNVQTFTLGIIAFAAAAGPLLTALGGLLNVLAPVIGLLGKLGVGATLAGTGAAGLGSAILALGTTLGRFATGPVGATVTVLGLLAAEMVKVRLAAERHKSAVDDFRKSLEGLDGVQVQVKIDDVAAQIDEVKRKYEEAKRFIDNAPIRFSAFEDPKLTAAREDVARLAQELKTLQEQYDAASRAAIRFKSQSELLGVDSPGAIAQQTREAVRAAQDAAKREPITPRVNDGAASTEVEEFGKKVQALLKSLEQSVEFDIPMPDIDARLLAAYERANALLATQKDRYSDVAVQLRDIIRQLENTPAIFARIRPATDIVPRMERDIQRGLAEPFQVKVTPLLERVDLTKPLEVAVKFDDVTLNASIEAYKRALAQIELGRLAGDTALVQAAEADANTALLRIRAVIETINTLIRSGAITAAQAAKVYDQIADKLREAGVSAADVANAQTKSVRTLGKVRDAANAAFDLADAFGVGVRRVRDIVLQMGRVIESVQQAQSAIRKAFEGGFNLGNITNIISGIAGVVGAVGGLVGLLDGKDSGIAQALDANNKRLRSLESELRNFEITIGTQLSASRVLQPVLAALEQLPKAFFAGTFRPNERFIQALHNAGLSLGDLDRIAEDLGIQLRDNSGRIIAGALKQLDQAIRLAAERAVRFTRSFDDATRIDDIRRNLQDITEPSAVINDLLKRLSEFAPKLGAQFAGLDSATAEGRAAIKAALNRLFEALVAGTIPLENFTDPTTGLGVNLEDLIRIITGVEDALDQIRETADSATRGLGTVPTGFKLALARFAADLGELPGTIKTPVISIPDLPEPPEILPPFTLDRIQEFTGRTQDATRALEELAGFLRGDIADRFGGTMPRATGALAEPAGAMVADARAQLVIQGGTYNFTVVQQPGEDVEEFGERLLLFFEGKAFTAFGDPTQWARLRSRKR